MAYVNDKSFSDLQYITADNIHEPKVTAIFATRNGGVSGQTPETRHLHSLNLKFDTDGESNENVSENYKIIASSQGFSLGDVIGLRQGHTDNVLVVDSVAEQSRTFCLLDEVADAVVTNIKGVLLSVRTADCVPILLYDNQNDAIGAIHAGWRGTFAQIGAKAIRRMTELYGTEPANIKAAIGPAVGVCCYDVDVNFYEKFRNQFGDRIDKYFVAPHGSKPHCDLKRINEALLVKAGVQIRNIDVSDLCTACNPKLFYSHRISGEKRGTMASFIGMKKI